MTDCLWSVLARTDKPIFLYGTGNGGDKIIAALERYGVRLTGIFASDGFVRDREFHGYKVQAYSDVRAQYGDDIVVLLAFGTTLPEVRAFIALLDERHDLRIPDVPLYGGDLFDGAYVDAHRDILDETEALLADAASIALFRDAIRFRLTGKLDALLTTEDWEVSLRTLLGHKQYDTILDGGAFKGDSTSLFARVLHPKRIIAVEADPKTHTKLAAYAAGETASAVTAVHAALWDTDKTLVYSSSGSRGAGQTGQNHRAREIEIPARRIDSILGDTRVDLIKLDVEGAEDRALIGAETAIQRDKPDLLLSLYHRTDDLYTLPQRVHTLLPTHRLYLRRIPCIPMWDLTLYAVHS